MVASAPEVLGATKTSAHTFKEHLMATQQSLFGATPEALQQQRAAALNQEAAQYAQMSPFERASFGIYKGANQLGGAVGGMLGGQDPQMQKASLMQQLSQQADTSTPEGMMSFAKALRDRGLQQESFQASQQAQAMQLQGAKLTAEQALAAQRNREARPAVPANIQTAQYIAQIPQQIAAATAEGDTATASRLAAELKTLTAPPPETRSEFEKIVDKLGLSDSAKKGIYAQWTAAKLNPDPSGLKSLASQMQSLQIQKLEQDLSSKRDKQAAEKTQAVSTLSKVEGDVDTALLTAERALKLAPGSFLGASFQAVSSAMPWSDAKAMKNLVASLNSEKAIQTLEQLKSQSRTGATGFGALSEKELDLLLAKTRSLDPTDKMFRENLQVIMDGWKNIKQVSRASRLSLQGQPAEASSGWGKATAK